MNVCIDTNALVTWSANKGDELDRARLDHLFARISEAKGRLIIPTPSLAEYLVCADDATSEWLAAIEKKRAFYVAPFDRRAAFECSLLDRVALASGDKRGGRKDSWQRVKVDRQILAIARANGATHLVTDDAGLIASARKTEIIVWSIADLEVPESAKQFKLPLQGGDAAGTASAAGPA